MTIYGPDIASYQGNPDMGMVRGGGNDFVIIKATESTGYVNPNFPGTRNNAHAAGMIVGLYHFARDTDPIAEAQYFINAIGGLRDNEFPVLDWEVPGDAANWSKVFLDETQRLTGVKAFIYLNQYYVNSFDWAAVAAAGYPLWIAIYDGDPWTFPSMRFWGSPPLKQYTDAASISGIAGNVDRNSFNGTREQLLAYCKGGSPAPAPAPTVQEDDMRIVRNSDSGGVFLVGEFDVQNVANPNVWNDLKAAGFPSSEVNGAQFATLQAQIAERRKNLMTEMQDNILGARPDAKPYLYDRVVAIHRGVGDPKAFAASIAAALPPASALSAADLETALRSILASWSKPAPSAS